MRKTIAIAMLVIASLSLFASDHQDVSISFGNGMYRFPEKGISFSYGLNLGLTERLEMGIWGISEAVPMPFEHNMLGLDFSYALIGRRSTASKVAGSGINMLLSLGGFYITENRGAGIIASFAPITIGSPITGRRERVLKTGVGYDFVNKRVIFSFSLISLDFYIRGTYRDYY